MNKTTIFSLLFFITTNITAQNIDRAFAGRITDNKLVKEPLAGVVCKAFDTNNEMLKFGISDDDGHFVLQDRDGKFYYLTFDYLGYQSKRIDIKYISNQSDIKIQLEETVFNLKEITVTAQPIQQTNDTVRYNVGSFLGQEDRHLADVLKKLPGISVNNDGTISYQGEAINKFYIEGHDLMGGQYGVATNNLPVDAVAQIQVLEHNQPIKVLKDVTLSDRAGINIKLKKTFLFKPFGEIDAGLGFSPLLYDGKVFAMQIGAKVQSLVNLKANNIGYNLENEMKDKLDFANEFSYSPPPENLIIANVMQNLPITDDRYLFNKSGIGSINSLVALAKETELRIGVSYLKDRLNRDFNLQQTFATGSVPLVIDESSRQINKSSNMQISALLEHNASHKYFKNELKTTFGENRNFETVSNDLKNTENSNGNKPVSLQNDLKGIIKYGDSRTINVNSFIRYFNNSETLDLEQNSCNLLSERIRGKNFLAKNRIATTFMLAGNTLGVGANLNYEFNDIDVKLPILEISDNLQEMQHFENVFSEHTSLLYSDLTLSYQIKYGNKSNTTFTVPFVLYSHSADKSGRNNKTGITPSVSNSLKINHQWETNIRTGYDLDYGKPFIVMIDNPFFRNHRQFYIPSGIIGERKGFHISSNLKYNNLVDMVFYNFSVLYRRNTSNYISKSHNTSDWSYLTTELKDNIGSQLIALMNFTKSFIPVRLVVTLTPQYTKIRSALIQQNTLFRNRSNVASLTMKLDSKYFRRFTVSYQAKGNAVWNDNNINNRLILKDLQHRMVVWYFSFKNFDVSLNGEHSLLEREKGRFDSYIFADFKSRYLLKKMELEFTVNNIFNNRHYAVTNLAGINSTFREFPLREREFMLSARMSF
ncbi:MAG: TonB-dependent receptor [Dysgonamonadaceae bacterium]|jgi:hypothetical protein|nr:TonB-dependent receptor [Dysgonamonadaceae bacterium]